MIPSVNHYTKQEKDHLSVALILEFYKAKSLESQSALRKCQRQF
jgi:hypothetical protein